MEIIVVGLNYKTAPVELRERFSFRPEEISEALQSLLGQKSILESVIISTCNRSEIYAVVDQERIGIHFIKTFISEWFQLERDVFEESLYIHTGDHGIRHLFQVACGLDSMVLGETQILGQVHEAWKVAHDARTTGRILNTLFKRAVTVAKKAHTETSIGEHAVSISYAAIELGKKVFGAFANKRVLLVGAGEMSELTAKYLAELGVSEVMVVNRSLNNAQALADQFDGSAYTMEYLQNCLAHADIVISSTGAPGYVVTKDDVEAILDDRKGNPLFMIDIAVPRDIESSTHDLPNVYVYDIDDLQGVVDANLAERANEAEKIGAFIAEELQSFREWYRTLEMFPILSALRQKAFAIQEETMKSIERKIPDLDERELKVLRKHTKSIVNQLIKDPILQLKELSGKSNSGEALDLFTQIFALEEHLLDEQLSAEEKMYASERETLYEKKQSSMKATPWETLPI